MVSRRPPTRKSMTAIASHSGTQRTTPANTCPIFSYSAGIQTLLDAEKEAAKIVAKARECASTLSHQELRGDWAMLGISHDAGSILNPALSCL